MHFYFFKFFAYSAGKSEIYFLSPSLLLSLRAVHWNRYNCMILLSRENSRAFTFSLYIFRALLVFCALHTCVNCTCMQYVCSFYPFFSIVALNETFFVSSNTHTHMRSVRLLPSLIYPYFIPIII